MKTAKSIPPKLAQRFLLWFLKDDLAEEVLGDLDEQFYCKHDKTSSFKAKLNYWYQVLNYLRPFAVGNRKSTNSNHYAMFQSYFKIGYRNLLRNKGYSFINIGGLAVGMAITILIGLWVNDELTYDQHNENYSKVAQVMQHQTFNGNKTSQSAIPFPLGTELSGTYGDDFKYVVMSSWEGDHTLANRDRNLSKSGIFMDVDAPYLLSFKMVKGTRDGLKEPGSILLSASTAKALFGESDAMGKMMKIDNDLNVAVTGIYEDLQSNSHFSNLLFIAPWELYISSQEWLMNARDNPNWDSNSFQLFAQIADHTDMQLVSAKIKSIKQDNLDESDKWLETEIFLHPMKDWHLRSNWVNGTKSGGFIQYVWMFGIVGVFVLMLACINFMNLSTAQSEKRAKEVGIRKSIGSVRSQLISQFLSESFLVVILSFVLAILLVFIGIPLFNQMAEKQITFHFMNPFFWLISMGFILVTGFLAGSYPALYLSSFKPVKVLKGTFKAGRSATMFRKILVVLQFTVSITLIIGTIMVEKQVQHSKNRPLGFDKNGVIVIGMNSPDFYGKYNLLRNELKNQRAIVEMTESSSPLTEVWNGNVGFSWEGKDPQLQTDFAVIWGTHDYGNTVGWEIMEGRDFSRDFVTDSTAFIINEAAVRFMGLENPVGKTIKWGDKEHMIIGVINDMLMESPFKSVKQTIYMIGYDDYANSILLRLNPDKSVNESLALVKNVFNKYLPDVPFDYLFADQEHARKFAAEERIGKLSGIFAILAIFISCLGLFGLASFMAEQRTKEIGIRKVLGASVLSLWKLLSRDYVVLVILSSIIAIPISYYALAKWLQNYEYQTEISWWIFVLAGIGALIITLFTVSYQTVKAGLKNPVESLSTE